MAFSPNAHTGTRLKSGKAVLAVVAFVLLLISAIMAPTPPAAHAAGIASTEDLTTEPVEVTALSVQFLSADTTTDGESPLISSRIVPQVLSATCDPASIQTGISCGMADMCGLDPCLCGAADEWGCCACSGTQTTVPTVTYRSSDESVVRIVEAFGQTWLVPTGTGSATITCEAELIHFSTTPTAFTVQVSGPTAADAIGLLLVISLLAAIADIIGLVTHFIRRGREE